MKLWSIWRKKVGNNQIHKAWKSNKQKRKEGESRIVSVSVAIKKKLDNRKLNWA